MRNQGLKTAFWRKAAQSLPATVLQRHQGDLERAERWELGLEKLIEFVERARTGTASPAAR